MVHGVHSVREWRGGQVTAVNYLTSMYEERGSYTYMCACTVAITWYSHVIST